MRVLVCGGRDYDDATAVWDALDGLFRESKHDCMKVIQGGATGADRLARVWCLHHSVPYDNYPADWKIQGRTAGPLRNQRMLDEGRPDIVLAFPGGKGTADMVRRARVAGVRVKAHGQAAPTESAPAEGSP